MGHILSSIFKSRFRLFLVLFFLTGVGVSSADGAPAAPGTRFPLLGSSGQLQLAVSPASSDGELWIFQGDQRYARLRRGPVEIEYYSEASTSTSSVFVMTAQTSGGDERSLLISLNIGRLLILPLSITFAPVVEWIGLSDGGFALALAHPEGHVAAVFAVSGRGHYRWISPAEMPTGTALVDLSRGPGGALMSRGQNLLRIQPDLADIAAVDYGNRDGRVLPSALSLMAYSHLSGRILGGIPLAEHPLSHLIPIPPDRRRAPESPWDQKINILEFGDRHSLVGYLNGAVALTGDDYLDPIQVILPAFRADAGTLDFPFGRDLEIMRLPGRLLPTGLNPSVERPGAEAEPPQIRVFARHIEVLREERGVTMRYAIDRASLRPTSRAQICSGYFRVR